MPRLTLIILLILSACDTYTPIPPDYAARLSFLDLQNRRNDTMMLRRIPDIDINVTDRLETADGFDVYTGWKRGVYMVFLRDTALMYDGLRSLELTNPADLPDGIHSLDFHYFDSWNIQHLYPLYVLFSPSVRDSQLRDNFAVLSRAGYAGIQVLYVKDPDFCPAVDVYNSKRNKIDRSEGTLWNLVANAGLDPNNG